VDGGRSQLKHAKLKHTNLDLVQQRHGLLHRRLQVQMVASLSLKRGKLLICVISEDFAGIF
jgi:hypothetical protein